MGGGHHRPYSNRTTNYPQEIPEYHGQIFENELVEIFSFETG